MMNLRLAVVLDRKGNTTNKGANTLYLGDYEICNAGEQSSRLYIEDSNGDEIEIEDTVTDKLELLKNKIIEVRENFITDEYKPKLLFMVREDGNKNTNYNNTTIERLFTKFNEDKHKHIPYHTHVNSLGAEVKLFPFLTEKSLYGVIEANNIQVFTEIMENFTNKMLENMNLIVTKMYDTLKLYATNISSADLMITESIYKLDNLITRSLANLIKADEMDRKYNELVSNLGFPDKLYYIDNLVNATNGRFSTINITSKSVAEDEREPFADVVVVAMSGSSIVSQCSFRVDKKGRMCSDFYGDSSFFFLQSNDSDCRLPIYVKNRYTYRICTSWNCNISSSPASAVGKTNSLHNFKKHLTSVMFDGTHFIASNGRRYRLDMDVDAYNGRILKTVDVDNGGVVTAIRSEDTSSYGRTLKLVKGNLVGFFRTLNYRTVPGLQPVITDSGGGKYYPTHKDPKMVTTGEVMVLYIEKDGGSSTGDRSPWSPITPSGLGIYEGYVSVRAVFRVLTANLDNHLLEFEIYNTDNHALKYYSGEKYYDHGSNYGGTHTYNYVLTSAQVQALGGMNARLSMRARMGLDKGSSHSKCGCNFYLNTR